VLFASTCDQLPDRSLHSFADNVVAAFSGPGDGLAEQLIGRSHPEVTTCTQMLSSLQVDFIDDEESSESSETSPTSMRTSETTYSQRMHKIKSGVTAGHSSNVYSFAHTDLSRTDHRPVTQVDSCSSSGQLIAALSDWKRRQSFAFGASVSLYEQHPNDGRKAGEPLADCFGIVARGNNACLALADGVNWGAGSRLAATSAVNGSMEYLNSVLIATKVQTTTQLFEQLLRYLLLHSFDAFTNF
jgi:uncharacterized membrane protein